MALSKTLQVGATYPVGETVYVYRGSLPDSSFQGPYPGSPVGSDTVTAAGTVTFTTLEPATSYVMQGLVGGTYEFIEFRTDVASGGLTVDETGQLSDGSDFVVLRSEMPTLNVRSEYGANGDGTGDDTAAINAAIADLPATTTLRGGTVIFEPGDYACAGKLIMDNLYGVRLRGESGRTTGQSPALRYTGSGSDSFISARSAAATVEGFHIHHTNPAYSGDLIDADWSPELSSDPTFRLIDCEVGTHTFNSTARSLLRLNRAITSAVKNCHFNYGNVGIRCGDQQYAVTVDIDECVFNYQHDSQIRLNATEVVSITKCTFEPRADGTPGAIDHATDTWSYDLNVMGNWFGDATGSGFWANLRTLGGLVAGNKFTWGPTGVNDAAINLLGGTERISIIGNNIGGSWGVNFDSPYVYSAALINNRYSTNSGQEIRNVANSLNHTILEGAIRNNVGGDFQATGAVTGTQSVGARVIGAAINDGYFDTPTDGRIAVDSSNNRLYVRVGGVWKYVALT